jgi:hypothetical protein
MSPHHLTSDAGFCLGQIGGALSARLRICGIACTAEGAVHVWPSLGPLDFFLVGDHPLLRSLLELYVIRLWRATPSAGFLWTGIPGSAIGARPFQPHITD